MFKKLINVNLSELSSVDFESLCLDILDITGEYHEIQMLGGRDISFEAFARNEDDKLVGIIVKNYSNKIDKSVFQKLLNNIDKLIEKDKRMKELVIMVSTQVSNDSLEFLNSYCKKNYIDLRVFSSKEISEMLNSNSSFYDKYIHKYILYKKIDIAKFIVSSVAAVGLALSLFSTINSFDKPKNIDSRISQVESAINNLNGLETYLQEIKGEMIETQQAKKRLDEEYKKAQELSKLSDQQLYAVGDAVSKTSRRDNIKNLIISFMLGVATSLVASFLFDKLKKLKMRRQKL